MDWSLVITAIGSALGGGLLTQFSKALLDKRKLEGEQRIAEAEQPVEQYAEIVKELRAELVRMGNVIDGIRREYEKSIAESRKEHADCLLRFGRLEGRLEEMTRRVNQVETTATAQHKQALTETAAMGHKVIREAAETAANVAAKVTGDSAIVKGSPPVDREHPLPVEIVTPTETS